MYGEEVKQQLREKWEIALAVAADKLIHAVLASSCSAFEKQAEGNKSVGQVDASVELSVVCRLRLLSYCTAKAWSDMRNHRRFF